jgi:hypothetical protein
MLIWIVIIGGLWAYTGQRDAAQTGIIRGTPATAGVKEAYALHLTPTFSLEPDPFALQTEDGAGTPFQLRLNGAPMEVADNPWQRGRPLVIEKVKGLLAGNNEIFVQASPPLAESDLQHGIRLQLLKSGVAVVDGTIWSRQGSLVSGAIHFQLQTTGREHDH